jgi:nicotinate-nucleotide--dimethylbenzimidazole phosphoribosyltransferase
MHKFNIEKPNRTIENKITDKINQKTKPPGSLGKLEEIALQVSLIQQTTAPTIENPAIVVFSSDHGIAKEGVSPFPQEVTKQMVLNFAGEGAAINVFAKQNGLDISIVDAGVIGEFPEELRSRILHYKIAEGTKNFLEEPAMTTDQCEEAIKKGAEITHQCYEKGCNLIGFGEMGIANTSSSALLMHFLTGEPLDICVGKGTGLDDKGVLKKKQILAKAAANYTGKNNGFPILQHFGGFEHAMMVGGFLKAAENKMTVLVDGFNVTAAFLAAYQIQPEIKDYCLFAHMSDENGHRKMLEYLEAKPLLQLEMRLGEGTGAAVAFPLVQSAVNFLNQMASFEDAGVSKSD